MLESWIEVFRSATSTVAPIVCALATVDSTSDPQVRCVICRRIALDGSLWFTSDARSAKMAEIAAHANAAAVCWLAESRRQFRFCGSVRVIANEEDRLQIWSELSPRARAMFFWPAPGAARAAGSEFTLCRDEMAPPDTFSLLSLAPTRVEELDLSSHPHRRRRWVLRGDWTCEELNP